MRTVDFRVFWISFDLWTIYEIGLVNLIEGGVKKAVSSTVDGIHQKQSRTHCITIEQNPINSIGMHGLVLHLTNL